MSKLKVGYIAGQSSKINERVIDNQWTKYLGEYVELVRIPPFRMIKLFSGSIERWVHSFPKGLESFSDELKKLCKEFMLDAFYINSPVFTPYLMLGRNYKNIDITFLTIAHSVASEFWLKHWLACAPWVTDKDVVLCSTDSCKKALLNISSNYQRAVQLPLCIDTLSMKSKESVRENIILSIGRIEQVKNIDQLIQSFQLIKEKVTDAKLIIAGEYTGSLKAEVNQFQEKIEGLISHYRLKESIHFTGPITGEEKHDWFHKAKALVNLSTDPGETFGFNLLEAKISGLPVICTNWDGFMEIVDHGYDGYRVDNDWNDELPKININQISEYFEELVGCEQTFNKMSKNAMKNGQAYRYQAIMPKLERILAEHSARKVSFPSIDLESTAKTPIVELETVYQQLKLVNIPFLQSCPIQVMNETAGLSYQKWMALVKPLIRHFTGRVQIGQY